MIYKIKIGLTMLSSLLFFSCFLAPTAVKDHHFDLVEKDSIKNDFFKLSVTSSNSKKIFLFENSNNEDFDSILFCNNFFKNKDCSKMELYADSQEYYTKNLKISDFEFYKRIKEDTIHITCFKSNNVKKLKFVYANN